MIRVKKSLLACLAVLSTSAAAVETSYEIVDLGALSEDTVFAMGVNNNNIATGYTAVSEVPAHGFFYQNGTLIDAGALVNPEYAVGIFAQTVSESVLFSLNDSDLGVGYSFEAIPEFDENGDPVMTLIDAGTADERSLQSATVAQRGVYTQLGSGVFNKIPQLIEGQDTRVRATSVNNDGLIVGFGDVNASDDKNSDGDPIDTTVSRAFIYNTALDEMTVLQPLDYDFRARSAVLRDINNQGIAVGWSQVPFEESFAYNGYFVNVNQPDTLQEIDVGETERSTFYNAINDNNLIGGRIFVAEDKHYKAALFDINTDTFTLLKPLVEGLDAESSLDNSVVNDINNQDEMVGSMIVKAVPDTFHAFIATATETFDLNKRIDCVADATTGLPDWVLYEATGINDSGYIVGNGLYKSERRAFMLIPRPGVEPVACPEREDEESGSGSLPWGLVALLSVVAWLRNPAKRNKP